MTKLNLLPEHYIQQRFRNRMDLILTVAFAVVMGVVVAIDLVSQRDYGTSARQREEVMARVEGEVGLLESFHRRQSLRQDVLVQLENVSLLEERVPRSSLLAILADRPEQVCLNRMTLRTQVYNASAVGSGARVERSADRPPAKLAGPAPVEPDTLQVVVTLSGLAEQHGQILDYCRRLKANPLVASATLGKMPRYSHYVELPSGKTLQVYFGFDITLELRPDADIRLLNEAAGQLAAGRQEDAR